MCSLLTCGSFDRLVVGHHCRMGHGRWVRGDWVQGEFGDLDKIPQFAPVHAICQGPRETMKKGAHLQHLVTQDAPLDMSARDLTMAVGL